MIDQFDIIHRNPIRYCHFNSALFPAVKQLLLFMGFQLNYLEEDDNGVDRSDESLKTC